jgi:hypothetical protein
MTYKVEVWRDHKRCECYVGKKKDIPKFISHTIDDYDNGECAYRIYRIFFGIYKRVSFRQKMKFLEQARK